MTTYMVVERFREGCFERVYERFRARGRMLPDGLVYVNSWVNREQNLCFQLMQTDDHDLFAVWTREWDDLTEFEIIPVD